jgi:holliday junction DNA helicase RuvA
MIAYLAGIARFVDADASGPSGGGVVVDVNGVGYRVLMPVPDLARTTVGAKLEVHVHTHVREDAIVLFGFSTREGLALFLRVLAVQGVGPKTALALLSLDAADLVRAIAERDEARLTKIPGVGKKTAARIVLELAEAFAKEQLTSSKPLSDRLGGGTLDDLRSALANLGYKAPQIDRAVQKVKPLADDGENVAALVREALKHVS